MNAKTSATHRTNEPNHGCRRLLELISIAGSDDDAKGYPNHDDEANEPICVITLRSYAANGADDHD